MSPLALGLGLALCASLALNGSYLLQHAGSATAPAITVRRPLATLASLLRSRRWLLGAAIGTGGWALHIGALSRAPLSLVQAFVAGGLVLAVPLVRPMLGHRLAAGERVGVALMAGSLVALCVGLGAGGRAPAGPGAAALVYLVGAGALALALAAGVSPGPRRAPALGLAGGVLYGAADMAVKGLTAAHHAGGLAGVLGSGWLPATVIASVGAFFCFQRGLQAGRALPVIALMTAGTNVVSILGGLVVFGDPLGRTPALATLHIAAFGVVALAAWLLAPTQAALAGEESSVPSGVATPGRTASAPAAAVAGRRADAAGGAEPACAGPAARPAPRSSPPTSTPA